MNQFKRTEREIRVKPVIQAKSSKIIDLFFPCSLLYWFSGFKISPVADEESRIKRWPDFGRLILMTIPWIYFPVSCLYSKRPENILSLEGLDSLGFVGMAYLFHLNNAIRGRKMRLFMKQLNENISKRLIVFIRLLSCLIFILNIFQTGQSIFQFEHDPSTEPLRSQNTSWVVIYILGFFDSVTFDVDLISMSIYYISLTLFFNWIRKKASRLLALAVTGDVNSMLDGLDEIKCFHDNFESLFNLNPFVWLSKGMTLGTWILMYGGKDGTDLFLAIRQACLISGLIFSSIISSKIARLGDQLVFTFSSATQNRRRVPYFLCRSIDEAFKRKFTAWNMFAIDLSLIASYLGAIVTFSVLFVQIKNGALEAATSQM